MKKVIKVFLLGIFFSISGCNEQLDNSCPFAINVDGMVYVTYDEVAEVIDEIEILGYITSTVMLSEMPSEDKQSNFPACLNQPYGERDGQMYIYYSGEWHICYLDND